MKRRMLILCLAIGLIGAVPLGAQSLQKGDQMVSGFVGAGGALGNSGVKTTSQLTGNATDTLDWGDESVSYGVQYLYALSPYFAIGAEYNGNRFDGSTYEEYSYWGSPKEQEIIDPDMDVHNFMAAGRFTFNPGAKTRVYIPFGVGVARAKATLDYSLDKVNGGVLQHTSGSQDESNTSFTYYVGLGVESHFSPHWLWGLEARYQAFEFDYGKFNDEWNKKTLDYVSILLKVGYKF